MTMLPGTETGVPFVTKVLLPSRRPSTVSRRRLLDLLHRHLDRRLTLVCAGAGYGKTTLLGDFAAEIEASVCWYSLDAQDSDPATFLRYLVASIRQRFPGFASWLEAPLTQSKGEVDQLVEIMGLLVSEIQSRLRDYIVLILDDYHLVEGSQPVQAMLGRFLAHPPENCHLILASRTDPRLRLARMEAQQLLTRLHTHELTLTPAETQQVLNRGFSMDVSLEEAERICNQYEGWAAGIILAALSATRRGPSGRPSGSEAEKDAAFAFLAQEVLEQQPQEVQGFLLASSTLEEMKPGQCQMLFLGTNAARMLDTLERNNAFVIRLVGEERRYRYHALFRQFLQEELRKRNAKLFVDLHALAGKLLSGEGHWAGAVSHFFKADRPDLVASLLEQQGQALMDHGHTQLVGEWVQRLPQILVRQRPWLQLLKARALDFQGRKGEALLAANIALQRFEELDDLPGRIRALGYGACLLRAGGRSAEAMAEAQTMVELASKLGDSRLLAEAYGVLGGTWALAGVGEGAEKALRAALSLHESLGNSYDVASLNEDLAYLYSQRGQFYPAIACLQKAARLWEQLGNESALARTLVNLGALHSYVGQYGEALDCVERALAKAKVSGPRVAELNAPATLGDILQDLGDLQGAARQYAEALRMAQETSDTYFLCYVQRALGNNHRLLGNLADAERHLLQALAASHRLGLPAELGATEAALGLLKSERGATDAVTLLRQACLRLEAAKAWRELPKARLYLSWAYHREGLSEGAIAALGSAVEAARNLDSDWPLLVEARRAEHVLRDLAKQEGADGVCRGLLQRIASVPAPSFTQFLRAPTREPTAAVPSLESRALGPAEVYKNGDLVTEREWISTKARELFFFLLAQDNGCGKEQITEALWPEVSPDRGTSSFHVAAFRLRQALYRACLRFANRRYRLDEHAHDKYDVDEYEQLAAEIEAKASQPEEALKKLRRLVALYRGSYLEDFYSDWCLPKRLALEETHLRILSRYAKILCHQGDNGAALEICAKALAMDPLYEEAIFIKMLSLSRLGERAKALRTFKEYEAALQGELGARPQRPLTELADAIYRDARESLSRIEL